MKKTLLALAVSTLATSAFAAPLDFRPATQPAPNTIASELNLPAQNLVTTTDALTWSLGFSVTTATQRYIRVTLDNGALFQAAPTLQVVPGGALTNVNGVVAQGGAGQNFVIFEITPAAGETLAPDAAVVLSLNNLTLTGKTNVGVSYRLFETAVDAVNQSNPLVNGANTFNQYLTFANGLSVAFEPATTQRVINVAANPTSTAFIGALDANSAEIGNVAIGVAANRLNYSMGLVTLPQLVAAGTSLQVNGDFTAALKAGANLSPAAVKLDGDATDATGTSANTLTATTATFVVDTATFGDLTTTPIRYIPVVYHVDGATAIVPSVYSGAYNVVAAANTSTSSVSNDRIGQLAKNGASKFVDLALNPNGAFQNFVRISNKTNVDGNVYITVFNDSGENRTISLGDIAGQSTSLAARSSTTQMTIEQIFNAAQAAGLALSGEGKLRLLVDGEFPTQGGTDDQNDYGLSVQTYTVATDGTTFSTF